MQNLKRYAIVLVVLLFTSTVYATVEFQIKHRENTVILEAIAATAEDTVFHKVLPVMDNISYDIISSENCSCELSEAFQLRDINFNVLTAYPDAGTGIEDTIRISLQKPESGNLNLYNPSPSFLRMYCSLLPEQAENFRDIEPSQPNVLYIYPGTDEPMFWEVYNYLKEWKREKGYKIYEYEYEGGGAETIKNYIQDAYDNWEEPPEYICIIGDAGGSFNVPTGNNSGGEGDHYYTTLAGEDQISDAHIGRLSFRSISEWQTIVYKIVMYEREPYIEDSSWFDRALLVGDPTTSGTSCVYTNVNIRELIENNHPGHNFLELYESPFIPGMFDLANQGISYFNYRGFWGMSGWNSGTAGYMNNGMMLPFAVISTCATGDFASEACCRSESFIRAGTTGNPRGGIGAIGTATCITHTCFNNCFVMGVAYGLFAEDLRTMGASHTRGKTGLFINYPQNPDDASTRFSYWNNLIGDPTIEVWYSEPEMIVLECEDSYSSSNDYISARILGEYGEPKSGLECCLTDSEHQSFCFSNDEGYAIIPLEDIEPEDLLLTVSGNQSYPVQEEIRYDDESGIEITNLVFSDESGNGTFEPNETGSIVINIQNNYISTLEDVNIELRASSEDVSIESGNIMIDEILSGEEIEIDEAVLHYGSISSDDSQYLFITISSDTISYSRTYHIPATDLEITMNSYQLTDGNNNIPETGETIFLNFELENTGEEVFENLEIELSSSSNLAVVENDLITISSLSPEEIYVSEESFEIIIEDEFIAGNELILSLIINTAAGYYQEIQISEEIGSEAASEPQGPDAGGYCIYDENDTEYITVDYDWIEISDTGALPLYDSGDAGDICHVELPFEFRFYGEEYNSMTICTNGWVCPGYTESASFMNWSIPGEGGISPMIAIFWDDLVTNYGGIYAQHLEDDHIYVIEWDEMRNDWDNSDETFELIIYDREYYPSSNGNNILKMQYKEFNNVNQGTYTGYHNANHGQFATIGIEDQTGTIGLEYTYNNTYPETGSALHDESAIIFGGEPVPNDAEWVVITDYSFINSEGEEFIVPGEELSLNITLTNIGNEESGNLDLWLETSNSLGVVIEADHFQTANIPSGEYLEETGIFNIAIDDNFPVLESLDFIIAIESNSRRWEYKLTERVTSPIMEILPEEIDFSEIIQFYEAENFLEIINRGSALLLIENIVSSCEELSFEPDNFNIESGSRDTLIVRYLSNATGAFQENLTIYSNSLTDSVKTIAVSGNVVPPPNISVDTSIHNLEVEEGENYIYDLNITNEGLGTLSCDAELDGYYNSELAAYFSGGYLDIYPPAIDFYEFTIETWACVQGDGFHQNTNNMLFCQRTNIPEDYRSTIAFFAEYGNITKFTLQGVNGTGTVLSTPAPSRFEWHHYAVTVTPNFVQLFIDGELRSSDINLESGNYWTDIYSTAIGAHRYRSQTKSTFNGYIDEMRIWNRELSHQEILDHKNHIVDLEADGLYAYWQFNEAGNWNDLINNEINVSVVGAVNLETSYAEINDWSVVSPSQVFLSPFESGIISLEIDPFWLTLGEEYETNIVISSNDPDTPTAIVPFQVEIVPNSENPDEIASGIRLYQNYPNPFYNKNDRSGYTTIEYEVPDDTEEAKMLIYNIKGQKVCTLILDTSENTAYWNGTNSRGISAGSGIYYYQLKVNGKAVSTRKMLILH